jgi:hypothetical protein
MKTEYTCLSTHGGSGYASGTHWDNGKLICGACGAIIENPNPTGARFVHEKGWRGWLLGCGHWVDRYGSAGEKPL